MHIAMLGTRGVPARYGGFETAVEEVGARLAQRGHRVTVFCRNRGQRLLRHRGMHLVNLPAIRQKHLETLSHTFASILHSSLYNADCAILFNAGNAPTIPLLKAMSVPTAVHMDGLEWQRPKWTGLASTYYRRAESFAIRHAEEVIADSLEICDYTSRTYGRKSQYIPYGAAILNPAATKLGTLGLVTREFYLVVARLVPENNVHVIIEGYLKSESRFPLVIVGDAAYGNDYRRTLERLARRGDVRLMGSVWDQDLLDQLYGNCIGYLHGHSAGGTNPSLLRALGCAAPTIAFDVPFNREVAQSHALYFADFAECAQQITRFDDSVLATRKMGTSAQSLVAERYNWERVTDSYEQLAQRLISKRRSG